MQQLSEGIHNEQEPCSDRGTETERLVELSQSSFVEIPSPGINQAPADNSISLDFFHQGCGVKGQMIEG